MNIYAVKKIELAECKNMDDYTQAVADAQEIYCKGLEEVTQYVGHKLKKGRFGYSGTVGNTEYIAYRVG